MREVLSEFSASRDRTTSTPPATHSQDGIVAVALGLGRTVVEGGNVVRFCPRYLATREFSSSRTFSETHSVSSGR